MAEIQGKTILINRGDVLSFDLKLKVNKTTDYTFHNGDKVVFAVYNKGKLNDPAVIFKVVNVSSDSSSVTINLTSQDTKIGDIKNKEVEYWYEIELNNGYTVIGYDKDGPKKFMLYPEGSRIE